MKKLSKMLKLTMLMVILSLTAPSVMPFANVTVTQAAAIKMNKKELTLEVGKTAALKVSGSKNKVTWTTSDKAVAEVSAKGIVTAKKAGTATITATVNKKKYTCKVTVKEAAVQNPENPYVKNAPFTAVASTTKEFSYVIPKDWTKTVLGEKGGTSVFLIYPTAGDPTKALSNVRVTVMEVSDDVTRESLKALVTEDFIKNQLLAQDKNATLADFKSSDYEAKSGTANKIEFTATVNGVTMKQVIYDILMNGKLIEVSVTDINDNVTPNVFTVGECLLNSLQVIK